MNYSPTKTGDDSTWKNNDCCTVEMHYANVTIFTA